MGATRLTDRIRILIVDDQADLRLLIRLTFGDPRFEVADASSAAAAQAACDLAIPDVMLLDVNMPGINGQEFCGQLRADRRFDRCAIILMTAGDQASERLRATEAGADHYLPKPFRPSELPGLVDALLKSKRDAS